MRAIWVNNTYPLNKYRINRLSRRSAPVINSKKVKKIIISDGITHIGSYAFAKFEILEEVPKDKLGEREKFYIELYGTDTQLNMKKGG